MWTHLPMIYSHKNVLQYETLADGLVLFSSSTFCITTGCTVYKSHWACAAHALCTSSCIYDNKHTDGSFFEWNSPGLHWITPKTNGEHKSLWQPTDNNTSCHGNQCLFAVTKGAAQFAGWNTDMYAWKMRTKGQFRLSVNAAITLAILVSLKAMESLQNRVGFWFCSDVIAFNSRNIASIFKAFTFGVNGP